MPRLIVASEALAVGSLTRRDLIRSYDRVYRNVYVKAGSDLNAVDRAVAAWLSTGRTATMAGLSAAALLGSKWVPGDASPELYATHCRAPVGILAHSGALRDDERTIRRGIPCTTAARTVYDLGRQLPLIDGVIRADALLRATKIGVDEVACLAERYAGARNIGRLCQVIDLADAGAESPQETRVRLLLVRSGLPRPETQIRFYWEDGLVRRRLDMGWRQWKVGVEYDGPQHWDDPEEHAGDIDRLEFYADIGWRLVRVSKRHMRNPDAIVRRAWHALRLAGWHPEAS